MMTATPEMVLDVSVAAKWALRDEMLIVEADGILNQFFAGSIGLVAPAYLLDEAANIFRTAVHRQRITAEDARRQYARLLVIRLPPFDATNERRIAALDLALDHGIAYYDALYLQVAQELQLPLLTADRPLYSRLVRAFPEMVYLGLL